MKVSHDELARAADMLRRGGLVAFPTETVYGLGANALDEAAVRRIFAVKGRPSSSPLIVHVTGCAMARTITTEWPEIADKLTSRFWPGPLTLVLPKAAHVPDAVTAGLPSVGVRVPDHAVALELIWLAGVPLAAPSANRFTQLSPTTAQHVRDGLGDAVDLILDGGPTLVGIESTVVSLTGSAPVLLRPGMIRVEDLEACSGVKFETRMAAGGPHESPGLHDRHYAPRTPLVILDEDSAKPAGRGRILELPQSPREFAAQLYARLHAADAEGWDWIGIRKPPDTGEWAGIRDRLQRASYAFVNSKAL